MLVQLLRTLILFILIIFSVRLMGKRTIGELQASELVVTMMLANLASVPMQDVDIPLSSGIVSIVGLSSLELMLSFLMLKSSRLARVVSGEPVVIIRNGQLIQSALRRLRMTNNDLFEELRKDGIFNIADVLWAVAETDGKVSVLRKASAEPVTAAGSGAKVNENSVFVPVISDGVVDTHALDMIGWKQPELDSAIKKSGLPVERIFLLTASADGQWNVTEREDNDK